MAGPIVGTDVQESELAPLVQLADGGQGIVYQTAYHLAGVPYQLLYKQYQRGTIGVAPLRALISWREQLDSVTRSLIVTRTSWPLRVVFRRNTPAGILIPKAPSDFYYDLQPSGRPTLREAAALFRPESIVAGLGLELPSQQERLLVCLRFAEVLQTLHAAGHAYGDVSAKNVLYNPNGPQTSVFLLDCDGVTVHGGGRATQDVDSPDWQDVDGGRTTSRESDVYKFGLFVLRCCAKHPTKSGNQWSVMQTHDASKARGTFLDHAGGKLLTSSLKKPYERPTIADWVSYLDRRWTQVSSARASRPKPVTPTGGSSTVTVPVVGQPTGRAWAPPPRRPIPPRPTPPTSPPSPVPAATRPAALARADGAQPASIARVAVCVVAVTTLIAQVPALWSFVTTHVSAFHGLDYLRYARSVEVQPTKTGAIALVVCSVLALATSRLTLPSRIVWVFHLALASTALATAWKYFPELRTLLVSQRVAFGAVLGLCVLALVPQFLAPVTWLRAFGAIAVLVLVTSAIAAAGGLKPHEPTLAPTRQVVLIGGRVELGQVAMLLRRPLHTPGQNCFLIYVYWRSGSEMTLDGSGVTLVSATDGTSYSEVSGHRGGSQGLPITVGIGRRSQFADLCFATGQSGVPHGEIDVNLPGAEVGWRY